MRMKGLKKLLFIAAALLFLVFSSPALFHAYARWYQAQPVVLPEGSHYSAGIVAGGFGSVDVAGNGYFNSAADRFIQIVRLYQTGIIDHILISGGNSKDNDSGFREAAWAKQQMTDLGVPASAILVEDRSNNTRDNARNSKKMLDSLDLRPPYLLVSSAFHLPRASRNFERAGIAVIPYPANYTEGRGPIGVSDFIPSLQTLSAWPRYVKEAAARVGEGSKFKIQNSKLKVQN